MEPDLRNRKTCDAAMTMMDEHGKTRIIRPFGTGENIGKTISEDAK